MWQRINQAVVNDGPGGMDHLLGKSNRGEDRPGEGYLFTGQKAPEREGVLISACRMDCDDRASFAQPAHSPKLTIAM
jgi:hypothetical protein